LNNRNFIFYSFYNEDSRNSNVYYITVDEAGNISTPNKLVSNCVRYALLISPDKLHFGIITYLRNEKPKANDPNYQTFSDAANFEFYEAKNVTKLFSKKLDDFSGNNKIYLNNFQINNNGTLSFLKKELDNSYIAQLKKLDLVIINPGTESPLYHNFAFPPAPNYMNSNVDYDLSLTKAGKLCASFVIYTKDFNSLCINTNTTKTEEINYEFNTNSPFSQSILDLRCKFAPLKTIGIGENLYTVFTSDSKFAMISKTNKDGALDWTIPFPFSNSIADLALLRPYKVLIQNNKINIYYIDHSENKNIIKLNASNFKEVKTATKLKGSNLVCLSVDENGLAKREVIYTNEVFSAIPSNYTNSDSFLNTHFDPFLENVPIIRMVSKDKEKFARIE
ncbi:MAG TPA: hypothetical protein PLC65_20480, partial [Bacteroidia bacterium]|nr:hypothetical protein [Bacteroidia bacterium]